MQSSHVPATSANTALAELICYVEEHRRADEPMGDLEQFEGELRAMVADVEREVMAEELSRHDLNVPEIIVDGVRYRQVLRCEETYFGASGEIRVERSLYSNRREEERSICPLELGAGLVEGRWTPLAAKQAAFVVSHVTPKDGEELFARLGGMSPSKSSLDRLPKQLGGRWEWRREEFEAAVRSQEEVPQEAAIVAVSLDGVMVPMKDGQRKAKRDRTAAEGKQTKGPAGFREAGCATLSFYNALGEQLSTIRLGRMPEAKKKTLKTMLAEELGAVLVQRPELELVKVADGAIDNWDFLVGALPEGEEVVDFYHACQQLHKGIEAAYGENDPRGKAQFEKLRRVLKEHDRGAAKVVRSLVHLRDRFPRRKKIREALGYFRRNRRRMEYSRLRADNLPIGSGVVEAACKTLVTQRLRRSGMRWSIEGGQAILTLRAMNQSGRFDRAWSILATTYMSEVALPKNVVPLRRRSAA